ncbi:MAG TPA: sigma-70 family RNA polymerase sigma factor [Anaerolineales bacterium]|nr:sigma-70 family RNA polymerase sigma factor [Anaerolineales bacterium]
MKVSQNADKIEKRLIRAAQRGDLDAFNLLILRHQNLLFGIAFRILHDEDAAADAVQEALISAFRKFNTFRGGSLRSWLARVVVNACYDEIRQQRRRHSVPLEHLNSAGEEIESNYWLLDSAAGPEERVEAAELDRAVQESLRTLPPVYRTVLALVDIEGLSYEEAAAAADVPVGTVKSRLARARLQMQKALQAFGELLPARYRVEMGISA